MPLHVAVRTQPPICSGADVPSFQIAPRRSATSCTSRTFFLCISDRDRASAAAVRPYPSVPERPSGLLKHLGHCTGRFFCNNDIWQGHVKPWICMSNATILAVPRDTICRENGRRATRSGP
ncbi:hypothetical protein IG631_16449 [Alternaria alternata]|nr:hypothetical protein IG631_16449 [Alternaria alternata]